MRRDVGSIAVFLRTLRLRAVFREPPLRYEAPVSTVTERAIHHESRIRALASQRAALVLVEAAPDPVGLPDVDGVVEALGAPPKWSKPPG